MSVPRRIVPGTTYLLTRRTSERRFFLRPSKKTNQIVKFCLGVAARRTGVAVHALAFLSNHFHLVATDTRGNLPVFMHWLDEYIAKCVNAELGRWESFWALGSYSQVRLTDSNSLIDKLLYTWVNPVEAGLVRCMKDWPGAISRPADMERPGETIARPTGFFRENGPVPDATVLELTKPAGLEIDIAELERLVAERERQIQRQAREKGWGFLGPRKVLEQSAFGRPRTRTDRSGLNPRVAGANRWRRAEVLQRLKSFLSDYRDALKAFREGQRNVVFPYGTYGIRVRFGVLCSGP